MENKIKNQKEELVKLGWKFLDKDLLIDVDKDLYEGIFGFRKDGLVFVFYKNGLITICASCSWYPITAKELSLFAEISEIVKNSK